MEVNKQLSDTGSFLDYSQGPSNIDVHPVYTTSHVGASKGLLSTHSLATYVLEGHNDQQYRQAENQVAELNDAEAVEAQAENQENYGDAEQGFGGEVHQHVEGSSHVVRAENVERITEAYEAAVDPTVLNSQAVEFNNQASSNLVTKQHELLHDGLEIKTDVVNQGQETHHAHHAEHVEHVHHAEHVYHTENVEHNVVVPETVEQHVVAEQHAHTEAAQPATTEAAAVHHNENVVEQTQPVATEPAGLATKGTIAFKPIEFRFTGEKNDKLAKVKPIFKAKVGGHHKTSHAGKFENEVFTWGETVVVGYSNQDDATLEVKKAGMFGKTIAAGKIALGEIIAQRHQHTLTVALLDKEKTVGELRVEVEFKPKAK